MNCTSFENLWLDYFDEALDGATRREVEEHLRECARCAVLVAEMRANRLLSSAIPELEPPPRLIHNIIAQTSGVGPTPAWYDFIFDFVRPQQLPKLAMGSLMAVASLTIVMYAMGIDFRNISTADFKPSHLWERTNREVHLAYSRGVRYYNALRIVYEIQSRFQTTEGPSDEQDQSAPSNQQPPVPSPSKPGSQRISEDHGVREFWVMNLGHAGDAGPPGDRGSLGFAGRLAPPELKRGRHNPDSTNLFYGGQS